jgi:hypothetical protein
MRLPDGAEALVRADDPVKERAPAAQRAYDKEHTGGVGRSGGLVVKTGPHALVITQFF